MIMAKCDRCGELEPTKGEGVHTALVVVVGCRTPLPKGWSRPTGVVEVVDDGGREATPDLCRHCTAALRDFLRAPLANETVMDPFA